MSLVLYREGKVIESFALYISTGLMLFVSSLSVINIGRGPTDSVIFALLLGMFYIAGLFIAWETRRIKREEGAIFLIEMFCLLFSLFIGFILYPLSSIVIGHGSISLDMGMLLAYFLITLQVCRNFILYFQRDFRFAYLIGIVLIILAASLSKQTAFIFYLTLYIVAGIFTLIYDYLSEYPRESVVGTERQNAIELFGLGGGVSVLVIGLGILIYLVTPRFASPNIRVFPSSGWGDYEEAGSPTDVSGRDEGYNFSFYKGFGRKFSLRKPVIEGVSPGEEEGELDFPNPIVMYVRANRHLYLRGQAFDHFDGSQWSIEKISKKKISSHRGYFKIEGEDLYDYEKAGQVYYIKEDLPGLIFSAYRPAELNFPSWTIQKDTAFILMPPGHLKKGTSYSVISHIPRYSPDRLFYDRSDYYLLSDEIKEAYLQLPEVSPGVAELSKEITHGSASAYEKAVAIEKHLRENYTSRLKYAFTGFPEEIDLVDYFLFELKEGNCELFATSMVVMCRSVGIPARLITGYVANESNYNPFTGYYEIRRLGHSWAEVYLKDHGWVPFDPTPSVTLEARMAERPKIFAASSLAQYIKRSIEDYLRLSPQTFWQRLVYKLLSFIKGLWDSLRDIVGRILQFLKDIFLGMGLIVMKVVRTFGMQLLGLAILLATLPLLWRYFVKPALTRREEERLSADDPKSFVILCYHKMCRKLELMGHRRLAYQTPTEYAAVLKDPLAGCFDSVSTITELFLEAMYSSHRITRADSLRVKQALDSIGGHKPADVVKY